MTAPVVSRSHAQPVAETVEGSGDWFARAAAVCADVPVTAPVTSEFGTWTVRQPSGCARPVDASSAWMHTCRLPKVEGKACENPARPWAPTARVTSGRAVAVRAESSTLPSTRTWTVIDSGESESNAQPATRISPGAVVTASMWPTGAALRTATVRQPMSGFGPVGTLIACTHTCRLPVSAGSVTSNPWLAPRLKWRPTSGRDPFAITPRTRTPSMRKCALMAAVVSGSKVHPRTRTPPGTGSTESSALSGVWFTTVTVRHRWGRRLGSATSPRSQ